MSSAVLAALIGAGGAIISPLLVLMVTKVLLPWLGQRHWKQVGEGQIKIHRALTDISTGTSASRAIYAFVSNGGDHISTSHPSWLSVLDERADYGVPAVGTIFQKYPLDPVYWDKVLNPLITSKHGHHTLWASDLPKDHWLEVLYRSQKIIRTEVYRINASFSEKHILILNFKHDKPLTAEELNTIYTALKTLREEIS